VSIFTPTGEHVHEPTCSVNRPTYEELASIFSVCWQRIYQLEKRALKKLRAGIEQDAREHGKTVQEWLRGE
jgi:hypothetical protein